MLAGEPADPTAEGVADDADVGGGAVQAGEAALGKLGDDLLPLGRGADPDPARVAVDLDTGEPGGVDQQGAAQGAEC